MVTSARSYPVSEMPQMNTTVTGPEPKTVHQWRVMTAAWMV